MNKLKAIIVDDEPDCIEVMQWLLKEHLKVELIAHANSADEGIDLIQELKPDLVFLDIEMPHKTGMDMLKAFQKPDFKVIVVTGYDQYALQAIKFAAIDYILKPIDKEELDLAIDKVIELRNLEDNRLEHFKDIHDQSEEMDRIIITSQNGFKTLFLNDIISIESKPGNYALFYTRSQSDLLCTKPLRYYDDLFPQSSFYRIHRSYIVNLNCVAAYDSHTGEISLTNDKKLEVAVRRRGEFNQLIKHRFSN